MVTIFKDLITKDLMDLLKFFNRLPLEAWQNQWKNPESFQKKYAHEPILLKWKELHEKALKVEHKAKISSWNATHKISVYDLVGNETVLIQGESINQDKSFPSCRLLKTIEADGRDRYAFLIRLG